MRRRPRRDTSWGGERAPKAARQVARNAVILAYENGASALLRAASVERGDPSLEAARLLALETGLGVLIGPPPSPPWGRGWRSRSRGRAGRGGLVRTITGITGHDTSLAQRPLSPRHSSSHASNNHGEAPVAVLDHEAGRALAGCAIPGGQYQHRLGFHLRRRKDIDRRHTPL